MRPREASLGPTCVEYREEVLDWAWGSCVKYRGTSLKVTGSLRRASQASFREVVGGVAEERAHLALGHCVKGSRLAVQ